MAVFNQKRINVSQLKRTSPQPGEVLVVGGNIPNDEGTASLQGPFIIYGNPAGENRTNFNTPGHKLYHNFPSGTAPTPTTPFNLTPFNLPVIATNLYGNSLDGTPFFDSQSDTLYILNQNKIDGIEGHIPIAGAGLVRKKLEDEFGKRYAFNWAEIVDCKLWFTDLRYDYDTDEYGYPFRIDLYPSDISGNKIALSDADYQQLPYINDLSGSFYNTNILLSPSLETNPPVYRKIVDGYPINDNIYNRSFVSYRLTGSYQAAITGTVQPLGVGEWVSSSVDIPAYNITSGGINQGGFKEFIMISGSAYAPERIWVNQDRFGEPNVLASAFNQIVTYAATDQPLFVKIYNRGDENDYFFYRIDVNSGANVFVDDLNSFNFANNLINLALVNPVLLGTGSSVPPGPSDHYIQTASIDIRYLQPVVDRFAPSVYYNSSYNRWAIASPYYYSASFDGTLYSASNPLFSTINGIISSSEQTYYEEGIGGVWDISDTASDFGGISALLGHFDSYISNNTGSGKENLCGTQLYVTRSYEDANFSFLSDGSAPLYANRESWSLADDGTTLPYGYFTIDCYERDRFYLDPEDCFTDNAGGFSVVYDGCVTMSFDPADWTSGNPNNTITTSSTSNWRPSNSSWHALCEF